MEWTLDPPDGLTRRDIYVNSEQFRNQKTYQDQTWDGLLKEIIHGFGFYLHGQCCLLHFMSSVK